MHSLRRFGFRRSSTTKSPIFKIQYISDLHLEYKKELPKITRKCGDYLALLGDIGNPFHQNYREFISIAADSYEKVFLVSGNHEYWQVDQSMDAVDHQIDRIASSHKNVHFMNKKKLSIAGFDIVGATLWSNVITSNKIHQQHVRWLSDAIKSCQQNTIVLTHHLPSYAMITPEYQTAYYAGTHSWYASHLDHLFAHPVKLWLCGHSHCSFATKINGISCCINAYGYKARQGEDHDYYFQQFACL